MKIKWLYISLSFLTLSLLIGSSAFIFYDGQTSIEIQREDNRDQLAKDLIFYNFISHYKIFMNQEVKERELIKINFEKFSESLKKLETELKLESQPKTKKIKDLAKKMRLLTLRKIDLSEELDVKQKHVDRSWEKIEADLVKEITMRMNNGEEFLPEFKKTLASWGKNVTFLKRLRDSIDVSYVSKDKFEETQELIDFSRWLIDFKNQKITDSLNWHKNEDVVLRKINNLPLSLESLNTINKYFRDYFENLRRHDSSRDKYNQVTKEMKNIQQQSQKIFEEEILPRWRKFVSSNYDRSISSRYQRLRKVVTAISLVGVIVILSMLFLFLNIFPNLEKLEKKAKEVAKGNYDVQFKTKIPNTEIGQVMLAFNEMSTQISLYLKELEKKESEKLQLNESIQNIRRLSQLGEFSAKMAHELKNPISILNFCLSDALEMIQNGNYTKGEEELLKCQKSLERIKITASKLGAKSHFSKKEKLNFKDLLFEIDKMYRALLLKERITLEFEFEEEEFPVIVPKLELLGAISNLFDNAIEYIRESTEIDSHIFVSLKKHHNNAIFAIKNGGPKIREPEKIFDNFHTTKESQVRGLGLIIVKDVIEECRGDVSYSFEGGLNVFKVSIPLA